MPKKRLLHLREILKHLENHREKKGDGAYCSDDRIFCPYEKEQVYQLLTAIINELWEINQQYPLKEKEAENK